MHKHRKPKDSGHKHSCPHSHKGQPVDNTEQYTSVSHKVHQQGGPCISRRRRKRRGKGAEEVKQTSQFASNSASLLAQGSVDQRNMRGHYNNKIEKTGRSISMDSTSKPGSSPPADAAGAFPLVADLDGAGSTAKKSKGSSFLDGFFSFSGAS